MRWRTRFSDRLLTREPPDCSIDFSETAGARWIANLARAHARLDQTTYLLWNHASACKFDLFASVTFSESEAIADRPCVSFRFHRHKFAKVTDSETCTAIAVINGPAIWIRTEAISFVVHAIEPLVLDVMKHGLLFHRPTLNAALPTTRYRTLIG
jgi:hypothetical protein